MQRRRWLLLCAATFVVVEALAALYALWPSLTAQSLVHRPELRLGVVALPPLGRSEEEWNSFAAAFNEKYACSVKIYQAASFDEGAYGLLNGSLDLLYTDAAGYVELNGKAKLRTWFYHCLSKREKERLRTALVCLKQISYINETSKLRLAFSGPSSMTGYYVPLRFLEERLPYKLQDWFSSVATAPDETEAFALLAKGEADLIACADITCEESAAKAGVAPNSLRRLWLSMALPENQLCSLESLPENLEAKLSNAVFSMGHTSPREEFLSAKSMVFQPPDHSFVEAMRSFQLFLEGPRESRSRTKVLKPD